MTARPRRAIAACAVVAASGAVAVVALLALTGGVSSSPPPPTVQPAVTAPFPAPPRGAVVVAREDRGSILALAIAPRASGVLLRVSVVGPLGKGTRGLRVMLGAGSSEGSRLQAASACGGGCYQALLRRRPAAVRVLVRRPERATAWEVRIPAHWPAPGASALMRRATRVWRQLRSLRYAERLRSDPSHMIVSQWRVVAPDRVAYEVTTGEQAVIIGRSRWDRQRGGAWTRSSALRLRQPQPFWRRVIDAHVIGSGHVGTRAVRRVSFFDPASSAWFEVAIDRRTARTLVVHMWATAHFMHDTYGQFNAPQKIVPPAP